VRFTGRRVLPFFHIALLYGSLGIKAKVGVRLRVPERTEERLRAVNLAVHQFISSIFFLERLLRTFFPEGESFGQSFCGYHPGKTIAIDTTVPNQRLTISLEIHLICFRHNKSELIFFMDKIIHENTSRISFLFILVTTTNI